MQTTIIAEKIIEIDDVPIHFDDTKNFSSVTFLKDNSNAVRGLHLPNCDSAEALEFCKTSTPDGFERIKQLVSTKCEFDEISFVCFSILHELGHWVQYTQFISEGHNDQEFIMLYELDRALLLLQRNVEFNLCRCREDGIALNRKYDALYAELPTEKYANEFALSHLLDAISKIK